jgi:CMP-N,N'-diacetyllegionaminic acid synthase
MLEGRPLVAWAIEVAARCPLISRTLVSTEDPEIREVSLKWGAEVIDRPPELAGDRVPSEDVVRHALIQLCSSLDFPDHLVLLQPSSPLRKSGQLTECLRAYLQSSAMSAISVGSSCPNPQKVLRVENGFLRAFAEPKNAPPELYLQNGAIYVVESNSFLRQQTFLLEPTLPYPMSAETSVDVDTICDLQLCEVILRNSPVI